MAMEPLQTRSELRAKLDAIRTICNYSYYLTMIVIGFIDLLWAFLLFVPLWFVMAAVYTQIDNYYEAQYMEAVMKRKKQVQQW